MEITDDRDSSNNTTSHKKNMAEGAHLEGKNQTRMIFFCFWLSRSETEGGAPGNLHYDFHVTLEGGKKGKVGWIV
jgi:hypothetical protein